MPIAKYGVLKGIAVDKQIEFESNSPHYQVHLRGDNTDFRIAINVKSTDRTKPEVLFYIDENFRHEIIQELPALANGFTPISSRPGGLAIDYVRSNIVRLSNMRILPHELPGEDNDLNEKVDFYINRAISNPNIILYAFGSRWGPENNKPDKIFKFSPGNGIHDIHMNQGNPRGSHDNDNGIYQDGALLIHFTNLDRWVAMFLAFQSQSWDTDEQGNQMMLETRLREERREGRSLSRGRIRILAAILNPVGVDLGKESVTLMNTTTQPINLEGWKLIDKFNHQQPLQGVIQAGETQKILLTSPEIALSNKGGLITLLDNNDLKVDGVSYTAQQAKKEGETIIFTQ